MKSLFALLTLVLVSISVAADGVYDSESARASVPGLTDAEETIAMESKLYDANRVDGFMPPHTIPEKQLDRILTLESNAKDLVAKVNAVEKEALKQVAKENNLQCIYYLNKGSVVVIHEADRNITRDVIYKLKQYHWPSPRPEATNSMSISQADKEFDDRVAREYDQDKLGGALCASFGYLIMISMGLLLLVWCIPSSGHKRHTH